MQLPSLCPRCSQNRQCQSPCARGTVQGPDKGTQGIKKPNSQEKTLKDKLAFCTKLEIQAQFFMPRIFHEHEDPITLYLICVSFYFGNQNTSRFPLHFAKTVGRALQHGQHLDQLLVSCECISLLPASMCKSMDTRSHTHMHTHR